MDMNDTSEPQSKRTPGRGQNALKRVAVVRVSIAMQDKRGIRAPLNQAAFQLRLENIVTGRFASGRIIPPIY
jgi:hypothetical protein